MWLMSGLPLNPDRPTSFERQLRLLAAGWGRRGVEAAVLGPRDWGPAGRPGILLGYPDQFPFLAEAAGPLFLWAQCSRPPDPRGFGEAAAVPLTARTASFLAEAGVGRTGPVIPHAVDTSFFRPPSPEERARARRALGVEGRFCLGAVGAHTYRKRFDLVLAACALLRERRPGAMLVLHTDRQMSPGGTDLVELAGRLGLGDGLVLSTGELPEAALRELYWALDVLVNLSEWEGFGLPVAEAMACSLPVATHRVQGPGELVPYTELMAGDSLRREEAGRQLLEARPATVAGLLAAADDEQLRRLGGQGRETAERCFSLHRVLGAGDALLRPGRG